MPASESRSFPLQTVRYDLETGCLYGYAAIFGVPTTPSELWGYRERLSPSAFRKTLQERDVPLYWHPRPGELLGSTRSGGLRLFQDLRGLGIELRLPPTLAGRQLLQAVRQRQPLLLTLAGEVLKEEIADSGCLRLVKEVRLGCLTLSVAGEGRVETLAPEAARSCAQSRARADVF